MGLLDSIAGRLGFVRRPQRPAARRSFNGASVDRLTATFSGSLTSINADLEAQLPMLRGRSRNLAANNELVRRYVKMAGRNIVGPTGFKMQARVMDPPRAVGQQPTLDRLASRALEDAWWRWTRRGVCDVTGKLSFADICRILAEGGPTDGEGLVRAVRSRDSLFGFQLQLLDIDRLDHTFNGLIGGNVVRMGVEINSVGAPVAYHILSRHPYDSGSYAGSYQRERVPASEIFHWFVPDKPEQLRGYPWIHAVMGGMNMLGGFEEAAVVAARVGASKMGFFKSTDGDGSPLADAEDPESGELMQEAEPGQFGVLPPGYEFESFNPDYPNQNFAPFVKSRTQRLSAGLDVAHHNLTGDMESVNYSSARIAELSERDAWRTAQEVMVESFVMPVALAWLETALLRGAVVLPNGSPIPATRLQKLSDGIAFQARRWQWVDPSKEVDAQITAIQAGLSSRTQVLAEAGMDLDETFTDLAAEQTQAESLGIDINGKPSPPAPAAGGNQP